jgi:hypothetical protein
MCGHRQGSDYLVILLHVINGGLKSVAVITFCETPFLRIRIEDDAALFPRFNNERIPGIVNIQSVPK